MDKESEQAFFPKKVQKPLEDARNKHENPGIGRYHSTKAKATGMITPGGFLVVKRSHNNEC